MTNIVKDLKLVAQFVCLLKKKLELRRKLHIVALKRFRYDPKL